MLVDYREAFAAHDFFVIDGAKGPGLIGVIELVSGVDHLLIENVAVDPTRQGEGLGRQLLAFAENEARNRNLGLLRLYTNALMAENIAFYLKRGFRETERRMLTNMDATVVYMEKRVLVTA